MTESKLNLKPKRKPNFYSVEWSPWWGPWCCPRGGRTIGRPAAPSRGSSCSPPAESRRDRVWKGRKERDNGWRDVWYDRLFLLRLNPNLQADAAGFNLAYKSKSSISGCNAILADTIKPITVPLFRLQERQSNPISPSSVLIWVSIRPKESTQRYGEEKTFYSCHFYVVSHSLNIFPEA